MNSLKLCKSQIGNFLSGLSHSHGQLSRWSCTNMPLISCYVLSGFLLKHVGYLCVIMMINLRSWSRSWSCDTREEKQLGPTANLIGINSNTCKFSNLKPSKIGQNNLRVPTSSGVMKWIGRSLPSLSVRGRYIVWLLSLLSRLAPAPRLSSDPDSWATRAEKWPRV